MSNRVASLAVLSLALLTACTGCAGPQATPPAPTTTTAFDGDDAASAAAERTYNAYVHASNDIDSTNPGTFTNLYRWETGQALKSDKDSLDTALANGWIVGGSSKPGSLEITQVDLQARPVVIAHACMDVSETTMVDAQGKSLVDPDRPKVQSLRIEYIDDNNAKFGLLISRIVGSDEEC